MSINLPAGQYLMYDEDGEILGQRGVKVHSLSDRSMNGPGICATLRTGFEPDTGDGVGVSLTITDEQLNELGYLTKEQVEQAIVKLFPDFVAKGDERSCGQRVVLNDLAYELGITGAYTLADRAKKKAEKPDEPINFLGGDVTMEELEEALKRSGLTGHVHLTPSYRCVFENTLRAAVSEIRKEKARPRYAYCGECREMVNPFISAYDGSDFGDEPYHNVDLEVFCTILKSWMPAYRDSKQAHGLDSACVDMDPPAHDPKAAEAW